MTENDDELRKTGDMKSEATVRTGNIRVKTESLVTVARSKVNEREVMTSTTTPKSSRYKPSHIPVK